MKYFILIVFYAFTLTPVEAQQFINKGTIEYEVKTNIKKTLGNSSWAQMMQGKLPNYKTAYYTYTFANNKSLYRFDHWESKDLLPEFFRQSDEKSFWYTNFETGQYNMQKDVFGSAFNIKDSMVHIKWRLSNESRIIAGFNCRKATGILMDSIYVFAFYTDEITISRLYTSWMATKITKNDQQAEIAEPTSGKNVFDSKKAYSTIIEKTKGWMNGSDPDSNKWLDQLIWNVLL